LLLVVVLWVLLMVHIHLRLHPTTTATTATTGCGHAVPDVPVRHSLGGRLPLHLQGREKGTARKVRH